MMTTALRFGERTSSKAEPDPQFPRPTSRDAGLTLDLPPQVQPQSEVVDFQSTAVSVWPLDIGEHLAQETGTTILHSAAEQASLLELPDEWLQQPAKEKGAPRRFSDLYGFWKGKVRFTYEEIKEAEVKLPEGF